MDLAKRKHGLRLLLLAGAGLALLSLPGCSFSIGTLDSTTTAGKDAPSESGPPPIENDLGPRGYRRLLNGSLNLLTEYWGNQLPDLGARNAEPPKRVISYWNRHEDPGCGRGKNGPGNAIYCATDDTISWDGNWMLHDLYQRTGDAAVMFVLAHEYGHLVQERLGIFNKYRHTIEAELSADCLAGVWLGSVDRKVARFNRADFRSLYTGVFEVADPRGVPLRNPSAHGNVTERSDAVDLGARRGQRECLRHYAPGFAD